MIANVIFVTVVIFLAIAFLLLDNLRFLAPCRHAIFTAHQNTIIVYFGLLFTNIFGLLFMIYRKFLFKDTGKKLKHLEKQLDTEGRIVITELDRTS